VTIALISGSSAATEAALAGNPTLLLDRESVGYHPLQELGEGKVVFKDWPSLWEGLHQHRSDPASVPGFGDWNPMAHRLDTFQDGKAADRMGQYIAWLCEAFESGNSRDDALAFAKQQYIDLWGADKITDLKDYRETVSAGDQFGLAWATGEPRL
jgi:hypothetical protein